MPTKATVTATLCSLGRGRRGRGRLLAAPAPALLGPGFGKEHGAARFGVGALEAAPPGFDLGRHFTARRAQREEIVSHAKARHFEQAIGAIARTGLEARLHGPHL